MMEKLLNWKRRRSTLLTLVLSITVLFASSVWVYNGATDNEVSEQTPLHMPGPGHVYTSSKIASEMLCHDYATLYKVPSTIFRYGIAR